MKAALHARRRLALAAAGGSAFVLFVAATRTPSLTEQIYGRVLGPALSSALSRLSGVVPFALAELLIVAFVARQLWSLGRGLNDVRRGARYAGNALAAGALRLAADLGIVVCAFYLLWGFHYARPSLEQRNGWDGGGADVEEVGRLAEQAVEATNLAYVSLHRTEDSGQPTGRVGEVDALVERLSAGWDLAATELGLSPLLTIGFGPPKPIAGSRALDYLGISGFYFPWTAEANFNRNIPAATLPHALAHEMAHQRGFAREDEANFAGFVVAAAARDPWSEYSAYLFAQRQLLATLARYDRDRAVELVEERLPGVQRDIDDVRAYWSRFEGTATRASRRVNDAFLRTNRVPGGILSYGRSVRLLVAYARSRDGGLSSATRGTSR